MLPNKTLVIMIPLMALVLTACGAADDPVKVTTKTAEGTFVDQMVAKSGGDPSKLTAEEKSKLDQVTRGHTDVVLRAGAKK